MYWQVLHGHSRGCGRCGLRYAWDDAKNVKTSKHSAEKVVEELRGRWSDPYRYAGYRVIKNIYNGNGVLMLPASVVLTNKDIELLLRQNIRLEANDVEQVTIEQLVNCSIVEIKHVFGKVRNTGQIPYRHLRERVLPIVIAMSAHPDLKPVFSYLEHHDEYTYRHSIGVAIIARLIGIAKGMKSHELMELTMAAFLHDIGKAKIPDEILNKPGKLSAEEFNQVKQHTLLGYELISGMEGFTHRQALVVLQHHEREDGGGYPYGLTGDEIDPHSKIVAIADVFHAMISKRVYKEPIPFYAVLQRMSENAFGVLEPSTTLLFLKRIMDMLIGHSVMLSNGDCGKIIMVNPHDPISPLVEVNGGYVDLSKCKSISLERVIN